MGLGVEVSGGTRTTASVGEASGSGEGGSAVVGAAGPQVLATSARPTAANARQKRGDQGPHPDQETMLEFFDMLPATLSLPVHSFFCEIKRRYRSSVYQTLSRGAKTRLTPRSTYAIIQLQPNSQAVTETSRPWPASREPPPVERQQPGRAEIPSRAARRKGPSWRTGVSKPGRVLPIQSQRSPACLAAKKGGIT